MIQAFLENPPQIYEKARATRGLQGFCITLPAWANAGLQPAVDRLPGDRRGDL